MNRRSIYVAIAVAAVPAAVVGWWLGSSLVIDRTVDEAFPMASSAVVPEDMTRAEVESVMTTLAKLNEEANEPMPAAATAPVALRRGTFRDADSFHRGSGTATIYRLSDGSRVLRLEAFQVTNGPDLRVLLSSHVGPGNRTELDAAGYVELDKLKGNIGAQNYPIPTDLDIAGQRSVVIYCRPFHVVFSVATLQPAT